MPRVIFEDRTLPWVPFATVAVIVIVFWGSMVWETETIVFPTQMALGLLVVLLLCLPLQGRVFWTRDISKLEMTDAGFEARTSQWIGWGRRVPFTAAEATWRAKTDIGTKVILTLRSEDYELDFKSAQVKDFEAFAAFAPEAVAEIQAKLVEAKPAPVAAG